MCVCVCVCVCVYLSVLLCARCSMCVCVALVRVCMVILFFDGHFHGDVCGSYQDSDNSGLKEGGLCDAAGLGSSRLKSAATCGYRDFQSASHGAQQELTPSPKSVTLARTMQRSHAEQERENLVSGEEPHAGYYCGKKELSVSTPSVRGGQAQVMLRPTQRNSQD